jgi:hypothetical protein
METCPSFGIANVDIRTISEKLGERLPAVAELVVHTVGKKCWLAVHQVLIHISKMTN